MLLIPARIIAIPRLWGCQMDTPAPELESNNASVASPGDTRLEVIHDTQGLSKGLEAVSGSVLYPHLPQLFPIIGPHSLHLQLGGTIDLGKEVPVIGLLLQV